MQLLKNIPPFLRSKYLLALLAFSVWMIFFDRNDFFTQRQRQTELHALEASKQYYLNEIARERKSLEELQTNPAAIEKYAREKYGMKCDNEDVFVVVEAEKN